MFVNIKVLLLINLVFFVPILSMSTETGPAEMPHLFQDMFALRNPNDQKSPAPVTSDDNTGAKVDCVDRKRSEQEQNPENNDAIGSFLSDPDEDKNLVLHRIVLERFCTGWDKYVFLKILSRPDTDINAQNRIGATALHIACSMGADGVIEVLLQHGADANIPAYGNLYPVHYVFLPIYGYRPRQYDLEFFEDGVIAEVYPFNPSGSAFFEMLEVIRGDVFTELIQMFQNKMTLEFNAKKNKKNFKFQNKFQKIANEILAKMSSEEAANKKKRKEEFDGKEAFDRKKPDQRIASIVRSLIKESKKLLNVDVKTACDGNTPLHLAVDSNFIECVKVLVEEGRANVNSMNVDGKTPLDKAQEHGFDDIVKFLKQHNAKNGAMHGEAHHDPSPEHDQDAEFHDEEPEEVVFS